MPSTTDTHWYCTVREATAAGNTDIMKNVREQEPKAVCRSLLDLLAASHPARAHTTIPLTCSQLSRSKSGRLSTECRLSSRGEEFLTPVPKNALMTRYTPKASNACAGFTDTKTLPYQHRI